MRYTSHYHSPLGNILLAADENGQLADGKWARSQWIMGCITVWQRTHNYGAAVTQQ